MATSDRISLEKQLDRAQRVLQLLQEQRSAYGMRVPVDLQLELEEQAERVELLEKELGRSRQPISQGSAVSQPAVSPALSAADESQSFDVFLCHNSKDKPQVIEVARQLQAKGLQPWLDEWELPPGVPWQALLEEQIGQVKSAAVFVGASGFGPWQEQEVAAFLRQFVKRKCPVIPVMLEAAPEQPQLPVFLEGMGWVDFRQPNSQPLKRLIWGITRVKPKF